MNVDSSTQDAQQCIQHTHSSSPRPGASTSRRAFLQTTLTGATIIAPAGLLAACDLVGNAQPSDTHTGTGNTYTNSISPTMGLGSQTLAFSEIMNDENTHVAFLQQELRKAGAVPRLKPTFKGLKQNSSDAFLRIAQLFENTSAGSYLLLTSTLDNKSFQTTISQILSIEARHAGFLNSLSEKPLSAAGAFDRIYARPEIAHTITPFIADLRGGKDLTATFEDDQDRLNFALVLEFLSAEFYNVNIPEFFK